MDNDKPLAGHEEKLEEEEAEENEQEEEHTVGDGAAGSVDNDTA